MVSGADDEAGAATAAAQQGACEVLRKPLDIDALRGAVSRALPLRPLPGSAARSPLGVTRVLAFLSEHVGQHVSLAALAGIATMSRSHLSRTFRSIVGIPLRTYVHDLRLERARQMLLARRPPSLTDVALEAGFYDLPHFDKAFRERFGLTPSEFVRRRGLAVVGARRRRRSV